MCGLAEHGLRMSAAAPRQGMSPYRRMIRTTTIPARSRDPRSPPHRSPPPPLPPLQSCCRRNIRALPRLLRWLRPPTPRVRAPAGCRVRGASRRAPRSDRAPMEPLSWPFSPPQHPCAPPALSGAPRRGGGQQHVRVARSVSTAPHTRRCVLAHSTRGQRSSPVVKCYMQMCRVRARAALRATRGARGASLSRGPAGRGEGLGWVWAARRRDGRPARTRQPRRARAHRGPRPVPHGGRRGRRAYVARKGKRGGGGRCRRQRCARTAVRCGAQGGGSRGDGDRLLGRRALCRNCVLARRGPALALAPLPMRWALAVLTPFAYTQLAATLQTVSTIRTSSRA